MLHWSSNYVKAIGYGIKKTVFISSVTISEMKFISLQLFLMSNLAVARTFPNFSTELISTSAHWWYVTSYSLFLIV